MMTNPLRLIPNQQEFNLKFSESADFLEVPEDLKSTYEYCLQCTAWIDQEMKKPDTDWDVQSLVNIMGKVASHLKMLKELDAALEFIETALALIKQYNLDQRQFVAQSLRWAEILRCRKEFAQANEVFEVVLEICDKMASLSDFKPATLSNMAKLQFDLSEFQLAKKYFEQALQIYTLKNEKEMISQVSKAIALIESKSGSQKI